MFELVNRHIYSCKHAANHYEATLVQLSCDFYMIDAKPENLIGNQAYDSDELVSQSW
jgi:hypothetical protein